MEVVLWPVFMAVLARRLVISHNDRKLVDQHQHSEVSQSNRHGILISKCLGPKVGNISEETPEAHQLRTNIHNLVITNELKFSKDYDLAFQILRKLFTAISFNLRMRSYLLIGSRQRNIFSDFILSQRPHV